MQIRRAWSLLGGDFQTRATLDYMRDEVVKSLYDPRVIQTAVSIVRNVSGRSAFRLSCAIDNWVRTRTSFLPDPLIPNGGEFLRTPALVLQEIDRMGFARVDCDDAAMLTAALVMSVGVPARFHVVAFVDPANSFQHVYTEALTETGWYALDVTAGTGERAPVSRDLYMEV